MAISYVISNVPLALYYTFYSNYSNLLRDFSLNIIKTYLKNIQNVIVNFICKIRKGFNVQPLFINIYNVQLSIFTLAVNICIFVKSCIHFCREIPKSPNGQPLFYTLSVTISLLFLQKHWSYFRKNYAGFN